MIESPQKPQRSRFPKLFWLVVLFEFFERGSYYGMMSVFSVYLTDYLQFSKESVGVLKGTIQPLLYFLPIITGALADRFGYRRTLTIAFALLGTGYFLTSQATEYATVFLALVVMGIGAGTFKPVISGTIAKCTDETNATLGFGIFYWSINLGAFLFPLFLVPFLKNSLGWDWVIMASAIGTGAMIIPTLLFFREPGGNKAPASSKDLPQGQAGKSATPNEPTPRSDAKPSRPGLLLTLAQAFEIIYSPLALLHGFMQRSLGGTVVVLLFSAGLLSAGLFSYASPKATSTTLQQAQVQGQSKPLTLRLQRNLCKAEVFAHADNTLTVYRPDEFPDHAQRAAEHLNHLGLDVDAEALVAALGHASSRVSLEVRTVPEMSVPFALEEERRGSGEYVLKVQSADTVERWQSDVLAALEGASPSLATLDSAALEKLQKGSGARPFFLLFVAILVAAALTIQRIAPRFQRLPSPGSKALWLLSSLAAIQCIIWLLPGLSLFARILTSVIGITPLSLYVIEIGNQSRFKDHFRFLSMIFIYAGFWVLYFQMFDSVLWYVQGYVDAGALNNAVNSAVGALGLDLQWRFDVEHVTVINAGTIIMLQLFISNIVKNTKALPTMIVGIMMGTTGMAILSLSTSIWVFMLGTFIFSIGEMTAHPKFIAYVGQTAPKSKVAMYMGYLFLYGVIGSSIGGVLGANLYVTYVDELNQPRTLWLIFAGIGVATVVGLLLFNRFAPKPAPERAS